MLFFGKPLQNIDENDLLSLVDDSVSESKTIDYKRQLPDNSHEGKREFLADISAFANTSGGFIIYGMDEQKGEASELIGLDVNDMDAEILKLSNIAQSSIEPRIPSLNFLPVALSTDKHAIVASIPKSWIAPHVVNFKKHWRIYSRNSGGKYPLDISEVRSLIIASETLRERKRNFRLERISKIISNEAPISLKSEPKMILTVIPLSAFDNYDQFDLNKIEENVRIKRAFGEHHRYNIDGYLSYYQRDDLTKYTQLFRNGIIEHMHANLHESTPDNSKKLIQSKRFEQTLMKMMDYFISIYKSTGIEPPFVIFLNMLGFKDYSMNVQYDYYITDEYPVDRNNLMTPEILLQNLNANPRQFMRPMIDAVWNAAGWHQSPSYDESGEWNPHNIY